MFDLVLFVAIIVSLVIGFLVGRYLSKSTPGSSVSVNYRWPQKRYYQGLTQLLNNQSDSAIDTFISELEVNSDTLETHLALGKLFRRRGEVDRAIRVHQNLLSRPSLGKKQSLEAQLELAVDYMRSGLLDRAESLFKELAAQSRTSKQMRDKALTYLAEVYQDMKEWLSAIDVADQLTTRKFSNSADQWREKQAQFGCEIAEEAIVQSDWQLARRWIRNAQRYDKKSIRALLLEARLAEIEGDAANSIAVLKKVPYIDARFVSEIIGPLVSQYAKLAPIDGLLEELLQLYKQYPDLSVLGAIIQLGLENNAPPERFGINVFEALQAHPQLTAQRELLNVIAENPSLSSLKAVNALIHSMLHYTCSRCGFSGEELHWNCPSCKQWGSIFRT